MTEALVGKHARRLRREHDGVLPRLHGHGIAHAVRLLTYRAADGLLKAGELVKSCHACAPGAVKLFFSLSHSELKNDTAGLIIIGNVCSKAGEKAIFAVSVKVLTFWHRDSGLLGKNRKIRKQQLLFLRKRDIPHGAVGIIRKLVAVDLETLYDGIVEYRGIRVSRRIESVQRPLKMVDVGYGSIVPEPAVVNAQERLLFDAGLHLFEHARLI